jgi:hypothetical protein
LIYSTGKTEAKYPSKWVTEIFIPVLSKIIPVKHTPTPAKSCYQDATATDAIEPAKETSHKVHRRKKKLSKATEEDS